MVKHIVLFKLKDTLSKEEKCEVMNRFKAAIEACQPHDKLILIKGSNSTRLVQAVPLL